MSHVTRSLSKQRSLTGAEGVVGTLELLAGGKVFALGGNALEVVGVVLEAKRDGTERVNNCHEEQSVGGCKRSVRVGMDVNQPMARLVLVGEAGLETVE